MKIVEMLPELDAAALATVHANALRLSSTGSDKQRAQADAVLPLIEAEQAKRGPTKPVRRAAPKARAVPARKRRPRLVDDEGDTEAVID